MHINDDSSSDIDAIKVHTERDSTSLTFSLSLCVCVSRPYPPSGSQLLLLHFIFSELSSEARNDSEFCHGKCDCVSGSLRRSSLKVSERSPKESSSDIRYCFSTLRSSATMASASSASPPETGISTCPLVDVVSWTLPSSK